MMMALPAVRQMMIMMMTALTNVRRWMRPGLLVVYLDGKMTIMMMNAWMIMVLRWNCSVGRHSTALTNVRRMQKQWLIAARKRPMVVITERQMMTMRVSGQMMMQGGASKAMSVRRSHDNSESKHHAFFDSCRLRHLTLITGPRTTRAPLHFHRWPAALIRLSIQPMTMRGRTATSSRSIARSSSELARMRPGMVTCVHQMLKKQH
jgi:hypothetical protein